MSGLSRTTLLAWTLTSFALGGLCCQTVPSITAAPSAGGSAAVGMRIGVINVQQAVLETKEGRNAQIEIKRLFEKHQEDLDRRQADLERFRSEIEGLPKSTPAEERDRKLSEWYRQSVDLQLDYTRYDKELKDRQAELTSPITKRVLSLIPRIAADRGLDLVMDVTTAVPYARPELDLTDTLTRVAAADGAAAAAP